MTKEETRKWLEDIKELFGDELNDDYRIEALNMAIDSLKKPTIHGHWIKINSGDEDFPESIVCDRCNHENSHLDFNEHNEPIGKVFVTSNFCPTCGADMREPKGEKGD